MRVNKNIVVPMWPNLSRAYEIALAGGYSIKLIYCKDSYPSAPKDFELIKETYSDIEFKVDGDLVVELYRPDYVNTLITGESISDIKNRVSKISEKTKYEFKSPNSCDSLLKVAYDRLNLSVSDVKKIKELSHVIARLHNSDLIHTEHLAEAIHYCYSLEPMHSTLGEDSRVELLDRLLEFEEIFDKWAQNKISSEEVVRLLCSENKES